MIQITSKSFVLQPNQVLPMSITGSVFSCAAATAPFLIQFDAKEWIPMQAGWTIDARPQTFTQIIFQNQTSLPISISFYAGNASLTYSPGEIDVVVTNAPTFTIGDAVAAGASKAFAGTTTANGAVKARKQIIVTNQDAAVTVTIMAGNGDYFAEVMPGQVWTLETNDTLTVVNPAGSSFQAQVGQIFYA